MDIKLLVDRQTDIRDIACLFVQYYSVEFGWLIFGLNVCLCASPLVCLIGRLVDRIVKDLGKCIICRPVHESSLMECW